MDRTQGTNSARNFLYRFPRFEASNRVDFICGSTILLGVCLDISESGIRCTFSNTVTPGTAGLMTVYKDEKSFSAHVVILEMQGEEAKARFDYQSPQEQAAIRALLKLLIPCSEF